MPAKAFMAAQDHQSGTTSSKHRGTNIKTHFKEKASEREKNKGKTGEMRRFVKNEGTEKELSYQDEVYDRSVGERRNNSGTAALTDEICNVYLSNARGNDGEKRSKSYPFNTSAATTQSNLHFQLENQFDSGGRGYQEDVRGKSRIHTSVLNHSTIKSRQFQRNGTKAAAGVRNLIEMVDEVVSRLV